MFCGILSSILAFLTAQDAQEVWKNYHNLLSKTSFFITDSSTKTTNQNNNTNIVLTFLNIIIDPSFLNISQFQILIFTTFKDFLFCSSYSHKILPPEREWMTRTRHRLRLIHYWKMGWVCCAACLGPWWNKIQWIVVVGNVGFPSVPIYK